MKKALMFNFVILCSVRCVCAQSVDAVTKGPTAAADEQTLLRMENDWNEAMQNHDITWFEKNLAGDMTAISSGNGARSTKAEEIEGMKTDRTKYESLELSFLKARVEGNAGIVTGMNHIRARDEQGQVVEMKLAFTDTYIKRDGHWQVWASQHTRIKP
jgi:ketosteroid isomerase-like protein